MTGGGKSSKIKISKSEKRKLTKKIDAQFYMYAGKKHGWINSHELDAHYEFDIIGFGNYVVTDKWPLED